MMWGACLTGPEDLTPWNRLGLKREIDLVSEQAVILLLEDNESDATLVRRAFAKGNVATRLLALDEQNPSGRPPCPPEKLLTFARSRLATNQPMQVRVGPDSDAG
jgi:hypothetical protein